VVFGIVIALALWVTAALVAGLILGWPSVLLGCLAVALAVVLVVVLILVIGLVEGHREGRVGRRSIRGGAGPDERTVDHRTPPPLGVSPPDRVVRRRLSSLARRSGDVHRSG
jgi:hypothetical protein